MLAAGMCRECYQQFVTSTGGVLQSGSNPPAFISAQLEERRLVRPPPCSPACGRLPCTENISGVTRNADGRRGCCRHWSRSKSWRSRSLRGKALQTRSSWPSLSLEHWRSRTLTRWI